VVGWLNTKLFDETGDARSRRGWTALILTPTATASGTTMSEPNQPVDPAKDKRIAQVFYA